VTKQSVSSRFTGYEIASLAAAGIHASRGTCTSLYSAHAMTGYMINQDFPGKHAPESVAAT